MVDEDISRLATPRFVPMLVPPLDWVKPDQGGFLRLHSQIMRTRGETAQKQALARADLRKVYHSLNCLGKVIFIQPTHTSTRQGSETDPLGDSVVQHDLL